MSTKALEKERIVLIVTPDVETRQWYSRALQAHISGIRVYTAADEREALFKMANVVPHLMITDEELPTSSGLELVRQVLSEPKLKEMSIIVSTPLPEQEMFVEAVLSGQLQFFVDRGDESAFDRLLVKALNRLSHLHQAEYFIRFLTPKEVLFKHGDVCEAVYIVKRGRLRAFRQATPDNTVVVLGEILPGEFVGEMAHINHDTRSASVEAVEDCELIEIPNGTLDLVLFSKPAWARALIQTLSLRLKRTNEALATQQRENARLTPEELEEKA